MGGHSTAAAGTVVSRWTLGTADQACDVGFC
jgi:hypothetical protein